MSKTEAISVLRKHRKEITRKQDELAAELKGVDQALDAMAPNGTKPTRVQRRKRKPMEHYEQAILDLIRSSSKRWNPVELATALDAPPASIRTAVRELVATSKVNQHGETHRGLPIIEHKPSTVVPGEGIKSTPPRSAS